MKFSAFQFLNQISNHNEQSNLFGCRNAYHSFLIGIKLIDEMGNTVFEQTQTQLSKLSSSQIKNDYVAKVKPGNIV